MIHVTRTACPSSTNVRPGTGDAYPCTPSCYNHIDLLLACMAPHVVVTAARGKPSHSHALRSRSAQVPHPTHRIEGEVLRSSRSPADTLRRHAASTTPSCPATPRRQLLEEATRAPSAANRCRRIQRQPSRARRQRLVTQQHFSVIPPSRPPHSARKDISPNPRPAAADGSGRSFLGVHHQESSPFGSPQGRPQSNHARLICRHKLAAVRLVILRHIHRQLRPESGAFSRSCSAEGQPLRQSGCLVPRRHQIPPSAGVVVHGRVIRRTLPAPPAPPSPDAHVAAIDAPSVSADERTLRRHAALSNIQADSGRRAAPDRAPHARPPTSSSACPPHQPVNLCALFGAHPVRPRPPHRGLPSPAPTKPPSSGATQSARFIFPTSCPSCGRVNNY